MKIHITRQVIDAWESNTHENWGGLIARATGQSCQAISNKTVTIGCKTWYLPPVFWEWAKGYPGMLVPLSFTLKTI